MLGSIKEWVLKKLGGTYINKFIRDGLLLAAGYLQVSEFSICTMTDVCKDLAGFIGGNVDSIVNGAASIVLAVLGLLMKVKAAKAETVGKQVLKG